MVTCKSLVGKEKKIFYYMMNSIKDQTYIKNNVYWAVSQRAMGLYTCVNSSSGLPGTSSTRVLGKPRHCSNMEAS